MKIILKTITILFYSSFILVAAEQNFSHIPPETISAISGHIEHDQLKAMDEEKAYVESNNMDSKLNHLFSKEQLPSNSENNSGYSYLNWIFKLTLKIGGEYCSYAYWTLKIYELAEYTGIIEYINNLYIKMTETAVEDKKTQVITQGKALSL